MLDRGRDLAGGPKDAQPKRSHPRLDPKPGSTLGRPGAPAKGPKDSLPRRHRLWRDPAASSMLGWYRGPASGSDD
jgi:hypothetical protein